MDTCQNLDKNHYHYHQPHRQQVEGTAGRVGDLKQKPDYGDGLEAGGSECVRLARRFVISEEIPQE